MKFMHAWLQYAQNPPAVCIKWPFIDPIMQLEISYKSCKQSCTDAVLGSTKLLIYYPQHTVAGGASLVISWTVSPEVASLQYGSRSVRMLCALRRAGDLLESPT
jgi:hypothetical protein